MNWVTVRIMVLTRKGNSYLAWHGGYAEAWEWLTGETINNYRSKHVLNYSNKGNNRWKLILFVSRELKMLNNISVGTLHILCFYFSAKYQNIYIIL